MDHLQGYINRMCPTYVSVPEDMLQAYIEMVHYCMAHGQLLVNNLGLAEELEAKATQFLHLREGQVAASKATIERVRLASQVFLYFLKEVLPIMPDSNIYGK